MGATAGHVAATPTRVLLIGAASAVTRTSRRSTEGVGPMLVTDGGLSLRSATEPRAIDPATSTAAAHCHACPKLPALAGTGTPGVTGASAGGAIATAGGSLAPGAGVTGRLLRDGDLPSRPVIHSTAAVAIASPMTHQGALARELRTT